ncbi:MAG: prephenate dehydratase [Schwartzia sp. (in: firmicutes)]
MMETMGYLGPSGTHSEAAALYLAKRLGTEMALRAYPDIFSAIEGVANGEVDSAFVPAENSIEGAVNITLDTLAVSEDLHIERELIWDIHHQLMARCPAEEIRTIYSHPQPLAQCRRFLKARFPLAQLLTTASTARAAKIVAEGEEGAAAICTARAGELYDLTPIATEIQDDMRNCTRFYQIRRPPLAPLPEGAGGRAAIVCQIEGAKAGSLCDVLWEFSSRQVNMTRIESRPARMGLGVYLFFFDLEIEALRPRAPLEEAIAAVRKKSLWLKDLGRFPVLTHETERHGEPAARPARP